MALPWENMRKVVTTGWTVWKKMLAAVEKREKKLLAGGLKKGKVKQAVYDKVPEKVGGLLEAAFSKAFKTVLSTERP